VRQGGTMDGTNCRSPLGVGMMDGPAIEQTWESNRAVRLENIGDTNVINPWLANGRNSFRTLDEIVASAVQPGMTDREKAHALWFQEIRHRYHGAGDNNELGAGEDVVHKHAEGRRGRADLHDRGRATVTSLGRSQPLAQAGHRVRRRRVLGWPQM